MYMALQFVIISAHNIQTPKLEGSRKNKLALEQVNQQ